MPPGMDLRNQRNQREIRGMHEFVRFVNGGV